MESGHVYDNSSITLQEKMTKIKEKEGKQGMVKEKGLIQSEVSYQICWSTSVG